MLTSANTHDEDVLGLRDLYAARCAEAGVEPQWADMPFFRVTYVAEDQKTAENDPQEAMDWVADLNGYRRTLNGGSEIYADLDHWVKTRPEDPPSYESRLRSTAYFGTPDRLVEGIENLRDQHNVQYYTAHFSYGSMEHEKVMRSMKLFADEVMPKFR
jgi:alkanesulfonate monooxygenase SsuD/methylene tetrahydromethanopterin reductase-like flavin-dependent oxidoreductase (luciferase family)